MVVRATLVTILLSIFCSLSVNAQRGCPQQSCDARGLNCQADFQVNRTKVQVAWAISLGTRQPNILQPAGCVGNDANIVCPFGLGNLRTYVSLDYFSGQPRWYDTLLTSASGLPIMNQAGDIIAVDDKHMEMRLTNGSLVGKPNNFYGYINNISSIHYIEEPNIFFFVSYQSGGMYMYDTSGMCVASNFLDEKDPKTNLTVSVWVPVNKLVVNTDVDPPCTYFIAQNNVTMKYRIYAVNFNHQPPYLLEKWHIDIEPYSTNVSDVRAVRMMARGNTLFCGLDSNRTLVIEDMGKSFQMLQSVPIRAVSFSSFDMPPGHGRRFGDQDSKPIVWINSGGVIYGWDSYGENDQFKYKLDLAVIYQFKSVRITSEIMVFGYHPEDVTLVVGFYAIQASEFSDHTGNYLAAFKVQPDGTVTGIWFTGQSGEVVGQMIGVKDSTLVITTKGDGPAMAIGLRLGK